MTSILELGEAALRPQTLDEYVGQEEAKHLFRVAIASANARNAPLPHALIWAPEPGIGKTSLAYVIGTEMGVDVEVVSGEITADHVRGKLARMRDRDILVIDEFHRVFNGGKKKGEWLLHLLEDGVLVGGRGAEEVPRVTILGTTTDIGLIPDTVLQRIALKPRLRPHNDREAYRIALQMCGHIFPAQLAMPSDDCLAKIARAAINQPRIMRNILTNLRDLALAGSVASDTGDYDLDEVLRWEGVTPDGLTTLAQEMLLKLAQTETGTLGIEQVAQQLGQIKAALVEPERLLTARDYIMIATGRGRTLTMAGWKRARELEVAA